MATHQPPQQVARWSRWYLLAIPPVVVAVLVALAIVMFLDDRAEERALDAELCPLDEAAIARRTVFLLDLRKPLGADQRALVADSLRTVTMALDANSELQVFVLADTDASPRRRVARLCKPYDNAQLAFEGAKDSSLTTRDCDELPAQVTAHVRDRARQFCARRTLIQAELDRLATTAPIGVVENAYLVEALEETALELANTSQPQSLYLFSDMLQHAAWYSQLDLDWADWTFEEFARLREVQDSLVGPRPAAVADVDVTIFYLPRQGVTDRPRTKVAHQQFWRRYFAEAFGATAVFREQPAGSAYAAAPLMGQTTEAELIVEERTLLEQEREEALRLLKQIEQERAALEEARRAAGDQPGTNEPVAAQESAEAISFDSTAADQPTAQAPAPPELQAVDPSGTDGALESGTEAISIADNAAEQPTAQTEGGGRDLVPAVDSGEADDAATLALAAADDGDPRLEAVEIGDPATQEGRTLRPEELAGVAPQQPLAPALAEDSPAPAVLLDPPTPSQDGPADCPLQLQRRYRANIGYPPNMRWAYASATIALRFVVDEAGETVDDAVTVMEAESTAEPPAYLGRFGDHARRLVNTWQYDFEDTDEPCTRRQEVTTQIEFRRRARPPTTPIR